MTKNVISRPMSKAQRETLLRNAGSNSHYNEETALRIIERVADGDLVKNVLREEGVSSSEWRKWTTKNHTLAKAYIVARQMSALSFEEKAVGAAENLMDNADGVTAPIVAAYNTYIGQMRWSAARRAPSEYGDHQTVSIRTPISIITPLDLNPEGDDKAEIADIYTIEAQPLLEFHGDEVKDQSNKSGAGSGSVRRTPSQAVDEKVETKKEPVRVSPPNRR